MKKKVIAAVLSSFCTALLYEPVSFGQAVSGTFETLCVTGTASVGALNSATATIHTLMVSGTSDFLGNSFLFGTISEGTLIGQAGVSVSFVDGANSSLHFAATRPAHDWVWEHHSNDQTSIIPAMKLTAGHVLTIFDATGSPAIVLDPSNQGGATAVLTTEVADNRYVGSAYLTVMPYEEGEFSVALVGGSATCPGSFAGINAAANGYYSIASGYASMVESGAWGSTASGYASTVGCDAWGSTASGFCSVVESGGWNALASGYYSYASGEHTAAIGQQSRAIAGYASAIGGESVASGWYSTALGGWSRASGDYAFTVGDHAEASDFCSAAIGYYSKASGWYSTAAGPYTTAYGFGQFVVGQCNIPQGISSVWSASDDLFVVGNGTRSMDPNYSRELYDEDGNQLPDIDSNAMVVKKNGDTTIYGKLTVGANNGSTDAPQSGFSIAYDNNTGTTAIKGDTTVSGAFVVTGTLDSARNTVVASSGNQLVLIPEQGDLSMGSFTNGKQPIAGVSSKSE